jgi:hypothetical protein
MWKISSLSFSANSKCNIKSPILTKGASKSHFATPFSFITPQKQSFSNRTPQTTRIPNPYSLRVPARRQFIVSPTQITKQGGFSQTTYFNQKRNLSTCSELDLKIGDQLEGYTLKEVRGAVQIAVTPKGNLLRKYKTTEI